jgi:hypothetical protein
MSTVRTQDHIDDQRVRDAVSRFLSDSATTTVRSYARREVRKSVHAVVNEILAAGWDAYLVGGTIRDIVLGPGIAGPSAYYPRDIDIILVGVKHAEVKRKFNHLYNRQTRFGGVHLIDRKLKGWEVLFDIWALEETWALRVMHWPPAIQYFPKTPFLNLDTAVVELRTHRGRPRRLFESGFLDGINRRVIEINFERNPYPAICMVRSLIMAAKLQFVIGPKLLDFVLQQARVTSLDQLMTAQRSHYGKDRCSPEELSSWIGSLQQLAKAGHKEGRIPVHTERQLALWNEYPPLDSSGDKTAEPSSTELVPA